MKEKQTTELIVPGWDPRLPPVDRMQPTELISAFSEQPLSEQSGMVVKYALGTRPVIAELGMTARPANYKQGRIIAYHAHTVGKRGFMQLDITEHLTGESVDGVVLAAWIEPAAEFHKTLAGIYNDIVDAYRRKLG